jgi:hypothetical protein
MHVVFILAETVPAKLEITLDALHVGAPVHLLQQNITLRTRLHKTQQIQMMSNNLHIHRADTCLPMLLFIRPDSVTLVANQWFLAGNLIIYGGEADCARISAGGGGARSSVGLGAEVVGEEDVGEEG